MSDMFTTLGEMIERYEKEPEPQYIWRGIQEGTFGFIFGPSKSGKTTVCECLAMAIVSGQQTFLGTPLKLKDKKVLMISLEEFWYNRTQRNNEQVSHYNPNRTEKPQWLANFMVVTPEFPREAGSAENWNILTDTIRQSEAKVVIIDSLTRLYDGAIEESRIAKPVCMKLRKLKDELKITLIIIHHTLKIGEKAITLDSLAGSRVIAQEADFLIGVNRVLNEDRYVKDVAYRYAQEADEAVLFDINDKRVVEVKGTSPEFKIFMEEDGRKVSHNRYLVKESVKELKDDQCIVHSSDLKDHLVSTRVISKPTLHKLLNEMVRDKELDQLGGGKYRVKGCNPKLPKAPDQSKIPEVGEDGTKS